MPKTKNAYALRSFEATKILQRRWFKDFNLPVDNDENVLLGFYNIVENENLEIITNLGERTVFYEALLERHITRLNEIKKYCTENFMATEKKIWKTKALQATELIKHYRDKIFLLVENIKISTKKGETLWKLK